MVDPRPLLEIEVRPLGAIARARPCAPAEAARSAIFALIRMLAKTIGLSMRNRAYSGSCRGIARPKAATWSITSVEFRHLLGRQESLQAAASTRRARIPKGGWLRRLAVRARAPTPDTPRRAQRRRRADRRARSYASSSMRASAAETERRDAGEAQGVHRSVIWPASRTASSRAGYVFIRDAATVSRARPERHLQRGPPRLRPTVIRPPPACESALIRIVIRAPERRTSLSPLPRSQVEEGDIRDPYQSQWVLDEQDDAADSPKVSHVSAGQECWQELRAKRNDAGDSKPEPFNECPRSAEHPSSTAHKARPALRSPQHCDKTREQKRKDHQGTTCEPQRHHYVFRPHRRIYFGDSPARPIPVA